MEIDINCDLGEGFGRYSSFNDAEIFPLISSCNVACGFHAGDPVVIYETIYKALLNNVKVGAHPSYPDLQGFGRRVIEMNADEIYSFVLYQICAVKGITEALGGTLNHVKPHGALYNYSANYAEVAEAIYKAIKRADPRLKVYGLPGSIHEVTARDTDLEFIPEGFGDRMYNSDGTLVPRSFRRAVLTIPKEVCEQVGNMVTNKKVITENGDNVSLKIKTICIHGDNENSISILRELNKYLDNSGIRVK